MEELKHLLPPKIFEVIERFGICTPKEIITLSLWDIKRLTYLCKADIMLLKDLVSDFISPKINTCDELIQPEMNTKLKSGFLRFDIMLKGGFKIGSITELYGESGSGKTQIGLQVAANNCPNFTVYICTEDQFPIKRFNEIKQGMPDNNSSFDYGAYTFVEHITESKDLFACIRVRLPKLLIQKKITLIVIDSIAAPFRVENTNYVQRAEEMREIAVSLLNLAQVYNLVILCINQVTGSFDNVEDLPALGLAWSNMVTTRLCLKKTAKSILAKCKQSDYESHVRELSVIFAPDLPAKLFTNFIITPHGLQDF